MVELVQRHARISCRTVEMRGPAAATISGDCVVRATSRLLDALYSRDYGIRG